MKKYLIILLIASLSLISIDLSSASVDLIIPLTLSSNDIHLGDSILAYANWNETINSSLIEYNSTSSELFNTTVGIEINNNKWTNYTIVTNTSWLLGSHSVKIYILSSMEEGEISSASNQAFFNLWGYSKSITQLSSDRIELGSSVIITCHVMDVNTSTPIENYYVEAFSDIEGDIVSVAGLTNSSGYREGVFTPTKNGTHTITCVLHDDTLKFYTAYSNISSSLTVIQPEIPTFAGRGILNVEKALTRSGLIEMPKGLNATLKDYNIKIINEENSTMNFSLYIGNQLVLKDSITPYESYIINYSTILDWKETYRLTNIHKIRIQVEGEHGFKSLITQNYTDVYADVFVSKKYPKVFEINVSSPEHLQNVFIEGKIPSEMDLDKLKLYHWNGNAYEDVTNLPEYNVSINKSKRKITFNVPSLSVQSFILMEGEMITTTTTTTIETTTVPKTTTTTRTTVPKTTTIPTCPACPSPSNWTECINGQRSRIKYKCDETTDYKCKSFTEVETCVVMEKYYYFIGIVVVILVCIVLIWEFDVIDKIKEKRKFKYHYKPK